MSYFQSMTKIECTMYVCDSRWHLYLILSIFICFSPLFNQPVMYFSTRWSYATTKQMLFVANGIIIRPILYSIMSTLISWREKEIAMQFVKCHNDNNALKECMEWELSAIATGVRAWMNSYMLLKTKGALSPSGHSYYQGFKLATHTQVFSIFVYNFIFVSVSLSLYIYTYIQMGQTHIMHNCFMALNVWVWANVVFLNIPIR